MSPSINVGWKSSYRELIDALLEAHDAVKGGQDICGLARARFLFVESVLLARHERQEPPRKKGAKLKARYTLSPYNKGDLQLERGQKVTVKEMWYLGGVWYVEVQAIAGGSPALLYPSSGFEEVKTEVTA